MHTVDRTITSSMMQRCLGEVRRRLKATPPAVVVPTEAAGVMAVTGIKMETVRWALWHGELCPVPRRLIDGRTALKLFASQDQRGVHIIAALNGQNHIDVISVAWTNKPAFRLVSSA
jgi:hypothetical protein